MLLIGSTKFLDPYSRLERMRIESEKMLKQQDCVFLKVVDISLFDWHPENPESCHLKKKTAFPSASEKIENG